MDWKLKAFIQNAIALLPKTLSYELYFQIQRHFGRLKKPYSPIHHFKVGVSIIENIQKYSYEIKDKTFFEVGTGRVPLLPVSFWLCGAGKIITFDLNPYMRNELIADMLFFINRDENEIKNIFGNLLDKERFNLLLDTAKKTEVDKKDILKLCRIEYVAPSDASETKLPDNCINYHISHTVYEHIPMNIIHDILIEGNRIITDDGLFINCIDYADHFAPTDKSISEINFLQYSDIKWGKYAGNRYMYMNRCRHDEFVELFKTVGHEFIEIRPNKNKTLFEMLEKGEIILDNKFKTKSIETLSITGSWFITKKLKQKTGRA